MLVLAVQTGLRISELIGLSHGDVVLDAGAHVRCMGKGRKERATPLTGLTVAVLRAWLTENPGQAHDPLFPTRTGTRLSHDAIEHRLAVHLATARASCPSLRTKHATMHTLRHTCAMRLRHAGIDVAVIALWLGHEQMATANIYLHADMEEKEEPSPESPRPTRRLAATSRPTRYSPSSTASDRSDLPPADSPATHTNPRSGRNNHDVGSIGDLKLFELITMCHLSR